MTVSLAPKRALSVLIGAALAGTALLSANPASALGSPFTDHDNLVLSPASTTYAENTVVGVSATGIDPGDYILGVCEYEIYWTTTAGGVAPIPACGVTQVPVTVSSNGILSASITLRGNELNAHRFIGSPQPTRIDLEDKLGEVILTPAHSGSGGTPIADSPEFNVI